MSVLVVNSGSSSVKAAVFEDVSLARLRDARVVGIGEATAELQVDGTVATLQCPDHATAIQTIFDALSVADDDTLNIDLVGHRVVHGGEKFVAPTVVTDEVELLVESLNGLAPLHNPACLAGIRVARSILPKCPHVAIFDTGFHATLPARAKLYALPADLTSEQPLRRFGFHGISHDYGTQAAADALRADRKNLRQISCHLGNGCSVAAVENGRSVETSMGMTPLEGLVMGTRAGDIDPGIVVQLLREEGRSVDELDTLLNRQSGLLGMTGTNDMEEIEARAAEGDESCRSAIHVFTHRVRKYIGAYAAAMGGVDLLVFTGGIGENSPFVRHRIAQRLDFLGACLDEDRNRDVRLSVDQPVVDISQATSRVKLMVVKADEEVAIAKQALQLLRQTTPVAASQEIPVAVSARHVHLTDASVTALFGPNHQLTPEYALSQPGQFAAKEVLTLVGPRNRIEEVRVLGPTRSGDQVEISRSDEFFLGVDAPIRASGDTENTPGITLLGPAGSVTLKNGLICALRHIHMHPSDAGRFRVQQGDLVNVTVSGGSRDLTFSDVLVRINEKFRLEMHVDTDEANAAGLHGRGVGTLSRLPE